MRRIDGHCVNSWRTAVTWLARGAGWTLLCIGGYLVAKKLLFAMGTRQLGMFLDVWEDIGEGHDTYRGCALLGVGLFLVGAGGWLARRIVTVPCAGCPRCGHEQNSGRCTECGFVIDDQPTG